MLPTLVEFVHLCPANPLPTTNTGTRIVSNCITQYSNPPSLFKMSLCACVTPLLLAIRYAAMGICWKSTARWRLRYPSPSANDWSAPYRISWMTIDKWPCLFRVTRNTSADIKHGQSATCKQMLLEATFFKAIFALVFKPTVFLVIWVDVWMQMSLLQDHTGVVHYID